MLKARPTKFGNWFWESFSRWGSWWSFHELKLSGELEIQTDKSILLIGNHISWWDGFWPIEINRRHFKKRYHVMMLEKELEQRQFMRKGGAFSIQPGNRSMIESLQYAAELLQDPQNLVLMYPQGRIHSLYDTNIQFAPGIERILKKAGDQVQLVCFVVRVDFFSNPKPSLRFYVKEFPLKASFSTDELNSFYKSFYSQTLAEQKALAASLG